MLNCLLKTIYETELKTQFLTLALASIVLMGCATVPDRNDAEAVAEYQETNDPG